MKIFIICPVRSQTEVEKEKLNEYILNLEEHGHTIYYPPRNTDQNDSIGLRICIDNREAIASSDEIHIFYNGNSQGSLFDFGMAFAMKKRIHLINSVKPTPFKSFQNVLLELNKDGSDIINSN